MLYIIQKAKMQKGPPKVSRQSVMAHKQYSYLKTRTYLFLLY